MDDFMKFFGAAGSSVVKEDVEKPPTKTPEIDSNSGTKESTPVSETGQTNLYTKKISACMQGDPEELRALPWFIKTKFIQDLKGRRPTDEAYDQSTLFVPPDELEKSLPSMQQYWYFKSRHYDKIICFMVGKFYELFYEDAILAHKLLDLNWMGDVKRLHVGFPAVSLQRHTKKLVDRGFKVCVVDQIDPKELNKKNVNHRTAPGLHAGRQIVQIMSKGTYVCDSRD